MDTAPARDGTRRNRREPTEAQRARSARQAATSPPPSAVGAGLGGLVVLTLLTVKATFLLYMGIALAIALAELTGAFAKRDINIPVIPVAAGGAAMVTCMYWLGCGLRSPRSR